MINVFVYVHVKGEYIQQFIKATEENARNSIQEKGILRFDFLQDENEPEKFLLIEVYKSADTPAEHKKTDHYLKWRSTVEEMMAEPRKGVRYNKLFSGDQAWEINV